VGDEVEEIDFLELIQQLQQVIDELMIDILE
jgi:hypothetical protein